MKTMCFQTSKAGWTLLFFDQWGSRDKNSPNREKNFESLSNGEYCVYKISFRYIDSKIRTYSLL